MYDRILHAASGQWFLGQILGHRVHVMSRTQVDQVASFLNKPEIEAQFTVHLQTLARKPKEGE